MTERMKEVYETIRKSFYGDVRGIMSARMIDYETSTRFGNSFRALVRKNKVVVSTLNGDKVFIAIS